MTNILCMQPKSTIQNGVSWYRVTQFANQANLSGLVDVSFLNLTDNTDKIKESFKKADLLYFRLSDTYAFDVFNTIVDSKTIKPMVLDIDDNYDVVDPFSDMYEVYGKEEVKLKSGEYLWKNGEGKFNTVKNKERLKRFHQLMSRMTAITTTTFELRNYALNYNDAVVVIPNAIDPNYFPPIKIQKPKNEIRILWSGGTSHYIDLVEVVDALASIMRENTNVHFYMLGSPFGGIIKKLPKDRVHSAGWVNADGHGYRLACMGADIMIGPLADIEFNKYKSSVKYYEAGALKVPFIGRNMPPYIDDIKHEENGLLYNDSAEFRSILIDLIKDPIKRIKIGQSAYNYVMKNRNIYDIAHDWSAFLTKVANVS